MRPFAVLLSIVFGLAGHTTPAADLGKLKVLYVGDPETPRAKQFEGFLRQNLGRVQIASRSAFKPAEANECDVVLLDWPQSGGAYQGRQIHAPLGERADWTRPTVLVGSAGLNLAVAWQVRGGSG